MPLPPRGTGRIVHGRSNLYGYGVGILMIEGYFPRLPGAIGNATTFPFPVLHRIVKGATSAVTVRELSALPPDSDEYRAAVAPWIAGAQALEEDGVKAITTSCGFSAIFQRELAAAVNIPVFASSLLLAPLISRMLKPGRLVGVISADGGSLGPRHLIGAGVDPASIAVVGLEGCPHFEETTYADHHDLNIDLLEAEVVSVATRMVDDDPRIGAVLLECSLLPPFAAAVQAAVRLPVFDFTHLVNMVQGAVVRQPFNGFL
ncbi:hypothetical protein N825_18180 [Skermanella stibiiresistens SB22]|uniref:Aspartate/glutamate racemase family protein n=1 Tax=Skermanella stibiiresistens SB22 TaxID=1385369 RepID=W9HB07_9PROT|nr:aspartate/glutamate racemase family protein [Skermanella stibiiresistens]EWY41892.1 hypothetical protein N825_18180 [Skermanella stibiiresistens SB22]